VCLEALGLNLNTDGTEVSTDAAAASADVNADPSTEVNVKAAKTVPSGDNAPRSLNGDAVQVSTSAADESEPENAKVST
jgi:hypothetical protein